MRSHFPSLTRPSRFACVVRPGGCPAYCVLHAICVYIKNHAVSRVCHLEAVARYVHKVLQPGDSLLNLPSQFV
jgi:hypothetical protein